MKNTKILLLLIFSAFIVFGCSRKIIENKSKQDKSPASYTSALSWYNVEDENAKYIELTDKLANISGLAFTDDNRLFADADDSSGIFQIEPASGKILKTFYVGDGKKKNVDEIKSRYEDLAIYGSRFFILNSHGKINECKEGSDGEFVEFTSYKLKLTKDNNIEGICFDPETSALLLACKDYPGDGYEKYKTIYSFSLSTMTMADTPRFALPEGKLKRNTIDGEFRPSGIARHKITGSFFIISYHGHTIIEVSKEGEIINQKDLPESIHPQPEGIAFSSDNTLYISDEGKGEKPRLTSYIITKK